MTIEERVDRNDRNIDIMTTSVTNLAMVVEVTNANLKQVAERLEKALVILGNVAILSERFN